VNNIPTPDVSGSISMSATVAKVALVNTTTALSGACPTSASIVDFVGFGTTANCNEGGANAPAPSTTTADIRGGGGCTDTDHNSTDFTAIAPNPRNTSTTAAPCNLSTNPSGTGSASPNPATQGTSTTLTATITPGTNPASTGITVSCDLTAIGGSSTFSLPNTSGNTYSASYSVPVVTAAQTYSLPCTVTDQSRSGSFSISLQVVTPTPTNPTGTGAANPNSLLAGAPTLLTVTVTAGTNPASTGVAVSADLSAIGGSATQQFYNDGTHGDAVAGDSIFSFSATVQSGTSPGSKSFPVTVTDAQSRSSLGTISLTVQTPPPSSIKISQVYGGGGNSGATYSNDFIELFNQSTSPVDVSTWSVQKASATLSNWEVTNLCANGGSCIIQPGRYYLVQEAAGTSVTAVPLPTADITGTIAMGAANGKIALVANTTLLTGNCPTGLAIVDFVGYGGAGAADCAEGTAAGLASNTTGVVRKANGCIDTNNNANDFAVGGPIPRNSASPVNSCGGDPTQMSGVGAGTPENVDPAGALLLTAAVTPATSPASTGLAVTGDLTAIGGSATQQFYDDGTHGDQTAGDNIFSFRTAPPSNAAYGAKSIQTTITDAQSRTAHAPITITVQAPTCGVERWAVKTGTDANAGAVDLNHPVRTTVSALRSIVAPTLNPNPPYDPRFAPTENTVFVVNGYITQYKLETDVDYHIVLTDPAGHTMVTEIPSPACDGSSGPFDALVAAVRARFDNRFTATDFFQTVNVPVQMTGVGFFDFLHGQTGVAPNGIELHPILNITFTTASTNVVTASANPSVFGQPVTLTATITSAGGAATGPVSFFDGSTLLGSGTLDGSGKATFTSSSLAVGGHSITASYDGDANIAQSASGALTLNISQPTVTIASSPSGLSFTASGTGCAPGGYTTPQNLTWTPGSQCTLAFSTPQGGGAGVQYAFNHWEDNSTIASRSITAQTTATYTATFNTQYLLTTAANPAAGGSVSGAGFYTSGSSVTAIPQANASYVFTGWSGACSGTAACTLTMNAAKSVTANFSQKYSLNVTVSPANGGSVTGTVNGAALNCSASCSATVSSGDVINLTATASSGYTFTAWTGCDSTSGGSCTVTMNSAKSVTANFTVQANALTYTAGTLALNRTTGRYQQSITVTNHGSAVAASAFVTDNLPAGVSLYQSSGTTSATSPAGSPYIELGAIGANASITATIQFTRTGTQTITYTGRVLGAGAR